MNHQELIEAVLQRLDLKQQDVGTLRIEYSTRTITILAADYRKFIVPFPEPDEGLEEAPRPKRVKAVKEVN